MPITPEQKLFALQESGYDPAQYDIDDNWFVVPKSQQSASPSLSTAQPAATDNGLQQPLLPKPAGGAETFVKEAIHSAPAAVVGGAGAFGGAKLGALAGAPFGPLGAVVGGGLGAIGGALSGSLLTSAVQDKIEQAVVPDYVAQRQANLAANPWSGVGGRLAVLPLGGMNPSLLNPVRALGTVGTTAAQIPKVGLTGALRTMPVNESANLLNVGLGTALGVGLPAGQQLAQGRSLGEIATSPEILEGLVSGAVFSKPNALGKSVYGFSEAPEVSQMRRFLEARRKPQSNLVKLPEVPTTEPLGPSRRAFEFEAAKQELAQQQQQEIANVEQQTRQIQLQKAQAELQKATQDLQQTLQSGQIAPGSERVPSPRVTTEMGREIYPDYTGAVEAENTYGRDIQGEEADIIQDRLERQQPNEEGVNTPEMDLATQRLAEERLSTRLSSTQLTRFQEQAQQRGVDVTPSTELQAKGTTYFPADRKQLERIAVDINPDKAGVDTPMHEGAGHAFFQFLRESPYASDKELIGRYEQLVKSSGALEALNKKRVEAGKKPWDAEELMASQQGVEAVLRDPQISKEGDWKMWWGDFKSKMKQILGNPNEEDLRRVIDYKWHTDPSFSSYFKTAANSAGVRSGATREMSSEEGFNTEAGDDVLSASPEEQAIAVRDALPAKLAPAPEGYRRVKIVKPDGGSYEAFFNDKYYDMPAPYGKLASIAKYTDNGQVTHSATKPGETIEELPSQVYRREQPTDEGLEDSRVFRTSAEKVASDYVKGYQPVHQVLATIKNKVPPIEWDLLKQAGIENAFGAGQRIDAADVKKWVEENGPKVEVHSYGMEGKVSEARREYDRMTHEWYDTQSAGIQHNIDNLLSGDVSMEEWKTEMRSIKGTLGTRVNSENFYENAAKYQNLYEAQKNEPRDTSPRATSAYTSVSPKDVKKFPVQRVDVVLGKKVNKANDIPDGVGGIANKDVLWQPDNLHENLPNTLGWAAIQYETGPNGEKIAHVFEAQSRWGQTRKKEMARRESQPMADSSYGKMQTADHPLLRDYNRLILKAAIEQARKEGATHIAVSDAESAMMTERHDQRVNTYAIHPDGKKENLGVTTDDIHAKTPEEKGWPKGTKLVKIPDQEPGMRLNYDKILPIIAEELTGSKGEKVSLGEHKNAFETRQDLVRGVPEQPTSKQRQNLIFRNPDGTPKTDVTARLYLLPERKGPFTLTERRQQPLNEGIYERTGFVGKAVRSKIAPEVEKLRAESPEAATGATKFYELNRAYRGQLEQSLLRELKSIRGAKSVKEFASQDNPDYQAVVKYFDAAMDGDELPMLTSEQQRIKDAVSANLQKSLDLRESFPDVGDIEGLARATGANPDYLPHIWSRSVATEIAERPTGAKAQKYFEDFIDYRTKKREQTVEEAEADWDTLRSMFTMQEDGNIASKFGAIDKAAGLGLPSSMREQHLLDRMSRFNRRFARRVAYHEAIQRNPEVSKAFFDKRKGVASTEAGRNVLEDIFGIREHNEATRNALSGVVRSLMLGPLTGAKDVVAGQVLGLQHMGLDQVLPAKASAFKDWADNYERAFTTGVLRDNVGSFEMGEGGLKNLQSVLQRSRDIINTVQGRNLLENVSRVLNFGEGRYLALDALTDAVQGKKLSETKQKFLKDFVEGWEGLEEVTPAMLDEAAAKYVESVQGTYDYRGLPSVAMKGTLSPYLSLARWNVEKFNNFTKHVVEPATKGNYKPLLMTTLGMFVGGTAVNELVEQVTGRKERTPTWSEIENSPEQTELLAYKLAALASLSGYAGVLGDVAKTVMDAQMKNRVQTWNNPLIDAAGTAVEDAGFLLEAMQEGDLPAITDVLHMLAQDYIQAYRVVLPHVSEEKQKELEDANARRDLKIWKQGQGKPVSSAATKRPNPLTGQVERKFKQAEDVQEAADLLPELFDQAIEDAKDIEGRVDFEQLKRNLSSLRRNSYQTVPSPETSPADTANFLDFVSKTQGEDVAAKRIQDYMRRNATNRVKSSLVPSL